MDRFVTLSYHQAIPMRSPRTPHYTEFLLPHRLRRIERIGRISGAEFKFLIPNEFVAGTHCYLVNRKGAQKLISVNNPVIIAPDGLIQGMVRSSAIEGARAITSAAGQQNSISSITQRMTNFR